MLKSLIYSKVAYCAIFVTLMGCSATHSSINNAAIDDTLNPDKVRARANAISSLSAAQAQEADALNRQATADANVVNIEAACMPKFLVTRCIEAARNARNDAWDAAQVDLTAARLFIRTFDANQRRLELQAKLTKFATEEKASAPIRAANAIAFKSKRAAYEQRQTEYAANKIATAPERAANVSAFEENRQKILAIQKKREADNKKRISQAGAQK